ncbi:MAG: hypothetical protein ACK41C_14555 [Phenylobacterium sp.]|uniref:hypothetical protein n=1 Tax=Phenylobacterium sp. TaxID=1871053 RepID=UPI003918738C
MRFVLVHSPLTGPQAWGPTAAVLASRGFEVTRPALPPWAALAPPFYRSLAAVTAAQYLGQDGPYVLVVHSGAGGLAPALAATGGEVAAVLYVDAIPPHPGRSWFDTAADALAQSLRDKAEEGCVPAWDQWFPPDALGSLLPDEAQRKAFLAGLSPTPLAWLEEPAPEVELPEHVGWGFLRLSKAYEREAGEARRLGWPTLRRDLHHLAMATHPQETVDGILALTRLLGLKP